MVLQIGEPTIMQHLPTQHQNTLVMSPSVISSPNTTTCLNIRSRKYYTEKCPNPQTHGLYCGVHYKNPKPWKPPSPVQKAKVRTRSETVSQKNAIALKIWKWYKQVRGHYFYRTRGHAYNVRSIATNDSDFFSADPVQDISDLMFFSYKDVDNHIYAFDIRSIHTLIHRARMSGTPAQNPFTRTNLDIAVIRRVNALVKHLQTHGISCEWAPLEPQTPEQRLCMKIVDLFHLIDELNYYSSPDWFLQMNIDDHLQFYSEIYAIWTHRAGLSITQKSAIVPGFTQLFRHLPWALRGQSLATMQKLNMNTIRTLITSAEDRNDRILGAMYVVSTLTLVNEDARRAYPWLYESIHDASAPESPPRDPRGDEEGAAGTDRERRGAVPFLNFLGIQWIQELLQADALPPLRLPPPAPARDDTDNMESHADETNIEE